MIDFGVSADQFEIVPFPIERQEYILQYTPKDAEYYISIFDAEDAEKYEIYKSMGLTVDVLWQRGEDEKVITGTQVRRAIAKGEDWSQLVPKTAYEYMVQNQLDERIKKLSYL